MPLVPQPFPFPQPLHPTHLLYYTDARKPLRYPLRVRLRVHSSVLRHGVVPAVAPSQTSGSQRTPDDAVYLLVYTERHQFPFKITVQQRVIYLNASHRMNRKLKEIGRMAGCPVKLTFYVSRHGWASIAQSQRIPLPVISEALGHDSENTTRIYLALLDTSVVDRANSKVIRSVCKQETRHV